MNILMAMRERVIEVAEENGWSVNMTSNDEDNFTYEFSKNSPAGQDFSFCADMEDNDVSSLIDNIYERYNDYDCSSETYIWLDNTGHGKNGAPYDMKDVYEDMEACAQMMLDLHNTLRAEDWSEYNDEEQIKNDNHLEELKMLVSSLYEDIKDSSTTEVWKKIDNFNRDADAMRKK